MPSEKPSTALIEELQLTEKDESERREELRDELENLSPEDFWESWKTYMMERGEEPSHGRLQEFVAHYELRTDFLPSATDWKKFLFQRFLPKEQHLFEMRDIPVERIALYAPHFNGEDILALELATTRNPRLTIDIANKYHPTRTGNEIIELFTDDILPNFENAYDKRFSVEHLKTFRKHPIPAKIANLYPSYLSASTIMQLYGYRYIHTGTPDQEFVFAEGVQILPEEIAQYNQQLIISRFGWLEWLVKNVPPEIANAYCPRFCNADDILIFRHAKWGEDVDIIPPGEAVQWPASLTAIDIRNLRATRHIRLEELKRYPSEFIDNISPEDIEWLINNKISPDYTARFLQLKFSVKQEDDRMKIIMDFLKQGISVDSAAQYPQNMDLNLVYHLCLTQVTPEEARKKNIQGVYLTDYYIVFHAKNGKTVLTVKR